MLERGHAMRRFASITTDANGPDVSDSTSDHLLAYLDSQRLKLAPQMNQAQNVQWGQYLTPLRTARFMASLSEISVPTINLLDAGAGIGALFGAAVNTLSCRESRPERIHVTAYEIDATLIPYLNVTANQCREVCEAVGIQFTADIRHADFIEDVVTSLQGGLFSSSALPAVNCAILNPPYGKIRSTSRHRKLLQKVGIETSNLYTGFLGLAIQLLQPQG